MLAAALAKAKEDTPDYLTIIPLKVLRWRSNLSAGSVWRSRPSLDHTGSRLEAGGELEMAAKMYQESLSIKKKNLVPTDPWIRWQSLLISLMCLSQEGKTSTANALYEEALAIYKKNGSGAHSELEQTLQSYADYLQRTKQTVHADQVYEGSQKSL